MSFIVNGVRFILNAAMGLIVGMGTTMKYLWMKKATIDYPKEPYPHAERFRGVHELRKYDDGLERCIGCELCAVACPANAITVIGAENDPKAPISPGERYGFRYEIDMLRCIFCGWCEEACPTDAIVLTPRFDLADFTRQRLVFGKDKLLVRDPFTQHMANTESAVETDPGVETSPITVFVGGSAGGTSVAGSTVAGSTSVEPRATP